MLDRLASRPGSRCSRIRVGRGNGSGCGKTCGRGQKGAGARRGAKRRFYYEGGQMPLARRLPKRGFRSAAHVVHQVINVGALNALYSGREVGVDSMEVDVDNLYAAGLIGDVRRPVKLLGEGAPPPITLHIRVHAASRVAQAKVREFGGSVEIVAKPRSEAAVK